MQSTLRIRVPLSAASSDSHYLRNNPRYCVVNGICRRKRSHRHHRRIGNSIPNPHGHNTPWTYSRQVLLWAKPHQPLTSGQRPHLFGVRRDLTRVTSEVCTLPIIRNWQPTPLAAPRQRLVYTNPRCAACAISTAQDYHPRVWSNSKSGIDTAPKPAGSIKCTQLLLTLGSARRCACRGQPSAAHRGSAGLRVFFPSLGCDIVAEFDSRPHSVYKITCVLP